MISHFRFQSKWLANVVQSVPDAVHMSILRLFCKDTRTQTDGEPKAFPTAKITYSL